MRTAHLVTALVTTVVVAGAPLGSPGDDKDRAEPFNELIKRLPDAQQRMNGAKLTIGYATISGKGDGRGLTVDWSIDYTGPRPPLAILTPTFDWPTCGQTKLYFVRKDDAGKARPFWLATETHDGPGPPDGPPFSVSRGGKPVSGVFTVPIRLVRKAGGRDVDAKGPLHLQVLHQPTDRGFRGGKGDLDAWTGGLWSNPLDIEFTD
jgi:hypothetical protein